MIVLPGFVDIRPHYTEHCKCNGRQIRSINIFAVEISECSLEADSCIFVRYRFDHGSLVVEHLPPCCTFSFVIAAPHATVNRRLVLDLVKRSASSGMAFLNAVLSKRLLVTVFHVIL